MMYVYVIAGTIALSANSFESLIAVRLCVEDVTGFFPVADVEHIQDRKLHLTASSLRDNL
jgi:hypothetical protein